MANAIRDVDTKFREDLDYELTAAAGQKFYKGTMVGVNAAGLAGNVSAAFPKIAGVLYLRENDLAGANGSPSTTLGGEKLRVRRGCHRFANNGSITAANLFQVCRAIDDQTVGMMGGIGPAGVVEAIDADGFVWVDFGVSRAVVTGNGIV